MQYASRETSPAKNIALFDEILDGSHLRRLDAKPLRLRVKMPVEVKIGLVKQHGRFRRAVKRGQPANHMVDVRMSAYNGTNT